MRGGGYCEEKSTRVFPLLRRKGCGYTEDKHYALVHVGMNGGGEVRRGRDSRLQVEGHDDKVHVQVNREGLRFTFRKLRERVLCALIIATGQRKLGNIVRGERVERGESLHRGAVVVANLHLCAKTVRMDEDGAKEQVR